jgi:hypothetical protein
MSLINNKKIFRLKAKTIINLSLNLTLFVNNLKKKLINFSKEQNKTKKIIKQ